MPRPKSQILWLPLIALAVLILDMVALTVRPPHLRQASVPQSVIEFAETLPASRAREADATQVEALLQSLSLEQKVGQLFLFGGWNSVSPEALEAVERYHLGNIVVDGESAPTLSALSRGIASAQEAAGAHNGGVPLLVASRQEGGRSDAISDPELLRLPSATELGAIATAEQAPNIEASAGALAAELRALGINANLGPVLDLGIEGSPLTRAERTFGRSEALVKRAGLGVVAGLQNNGVAACAKHFPGAGQTTVDMASGLPVINLSATDLETQDLQPFAAAVRGEVAMVMIGHLCFPLLQGERKQPGWQSSLMVQALRTKLGFQGVIVTDDLMKGARDATPLPQQALNALTAGCDLIYYTGGPEGAASIAEGVVRAVNNGELSMERIDESLRRILRLKSAYELFADLSAPPAYLAHNAFPDRQAHRATVGTLYEALELMQSPNQPKQVEALYANAEPIRLPPGGTILVAHVDRTDFTARYRGLTLAEQVRGLYPQVIDMPFTLEPDTRQAELDRFARLSDQADVILLGTWKQAGPGQRELFRAVRDANKPLLVLSRFANKRDNSEIPSEASQVYWIANNSVSLLAALEELFKESLLLPAEGAVAPAESEHEEGAFD